ncbi:hypothetical protein Tco_1230756, partial [Tanacetum coccineum]
MTEEEEEDRISWLPDLLLLEIISRIKVKIKDYEEQEQEQEQERLMTTKEVIKTTAPISKRWQHLWTKLATLRLIYFYDDFTRIIASHHGDILSTLFQLSLLEEQPVKKVVLDETIDLLASNEHPKLSKTRARGWYLLSRGTVHVCNSRDMFVDYLPLTGHEVVLENNSPVDVVGFGTVKLQLTSGKVLILENVFHMPKIT